MDKKMKIRVILKSGAEFTTICENFTLDRNALGQVVRYDFKGIEENKPVYLDFSEVAAMVRLLSNEGGDDVS